MMNKRIWLFVLVVVAILSANLVHLYAASNTTPSAPTLSFTPMTPTNGNVTVTIYYPKTASIKQYKLGTDGVWTTYYAPVVVTSNVYVYARYQTSAGYWSALGGYPIKNIDKTPPLAPTFSLSSTVETNQDVTVTINFSSDSTNKQYKLDSDSTWINYTNTIVLSSNTTIYAKASDSVGNWTSIVSYTVSNIDNTKPSMPILTADIVSPTNGDVNITVAYPDDAKIKQYRIGNDSNWIDYNGSILITSNTVVYAKASDSAGNWSDEAVYIVNNIDKVAPDAPVIISSTTRLTDEPVIISIDFSQDSVLRQYKIGAIGNWLDYTDPLNINTNTTVYSRASDIAGNWSIEAAFGITNIRRTVMAYTVKNYSTDVSSYNSIKANTTTINEIATATYSVDGLGNLTGTAPMDQISYANSNGIRTKLMVSNSFDAALAKQLLESPANRENLKNNIISLLKANNYTGVDIDIENIPASCRNYFTTFMSEIYSVLKPLGYGVSVAVQAKTYDSPNATWNYAFDYKSLAQYSDFLMIMAYDEHYAGGIPGAVASINWVTSVIDYALTVVPKEKIVLGMAAYGYDWGGTTTKAYSINGCYNVASQYGAIVKFDDVTKSKYFTYMVNGVSHTVWFEDGETIAYKLDLANSKDLKGVGIWRLGLENSNYWSTIKEKFNK
ncbi:glycosyl hydrolase family 18 protein [Pseudobacteroides cellulosolvens]|uniref:Glycoside hydrolase family 18 n=1 Tax=Pseudobacteroides cellulosolvens ATCC 35603 = DSM 2933 TaxID=398512 RepID=A0A0L6JKE9_9FIRM|nr:glycosyl hydrolase family 18 protein [Pseudobacteroides cellulosolvens]KNY26225.1 glycoside hydrolase family 18 [Pseudobacteroides cellulosolvens ATCC 35603 = DSM 2933]